MTIAIDTKSTRQNATDDRERRRDEIFRDGARFAAWRKGDGVSTRIAGRCARDPDEGQEIARVM
jgi:hypothetical protein